MKKNWNELEDKYIIDNINVLSWKEIAQHINCSITTVQKRATFLGLEFNHISHERWTDEEVNQLREYSTKYLAKTIAKKMNRSYNSIKKKAFKEGIELKFKNELWKKWMIYYLKDNINKQSIKQISSFIGLSEYSVRTKCEELGLIYDNKRWTKEEEQVLLDNYAKCHYSQLTKLIPNKSKSAILAKARSMNLNIIIEKHEYSEDIETYVVDNWGKMSIADMARALKIPRSRIYVYKEKHNLPNIGQKIKWNEKRVNKLKTLSKTKTRAELAKIFNTSENGISTVANRYQIKLIDTKKALSDVQIDKLKEMAPDYTINELSQIFNISAGSLRTIFKRNNIKAKKDISNHWTEEELELLKSLVNKNVPIYEIMKSINKMDNTIISKCKELNLDYVAIPKREWAPNEIEELKQDAMYMNINELIMKYKRSSYSIKKLLSKNNIKIIGNIDYWKEEEVKSLVELYEDGKTVIEIANILNRTITSVEIKMKKEGLVISSNRRYWTKEEEQFLKDNWNEHTIYYLSKRLNRTRSSIVNKAFSLNLKEHFLHPEALKISEIAEIFNVTRNEIDTTWMILGLPYKTQKISKNKSYKYVEIDDLFNFLEYNQFLFDGKDFEENILGKEPEWVKVKRKHDYFDGFNKNYIKLEKKKLLQEKKYYLELLKDNNNVKKLKK